MVVISPLNVRLPFQIHPWVNYDQILQKCFVGRLVSLELGVDAEALLFGRRTSTDSEHGPTRAKTPQLPKKNEAKTEEPLQKQEPEPLKQEFILPINSPEFREPKVKFLEKYPPKVDSVSQEEQPDEGPALPRFDWIQRTRWINFIFYTTPFSNPLVEVLPPDQERTLTVTFIYDETIFTNEIALHDQVNWPGTVQVSYETGKIELEFMKTEGKLWVDFGELTQDCKPVGTTINCCAKCNYVFSERKQVTHNTFVVRLERTDKGRVVVPIGRHVRVFGNMDGECAFAVDIPSKVVSKSYEL